MATTEQHFRTWAGQGEHCNDSSEELAARHGRRDLYAIARCLACGEHFANAFVLWRHRPTDVPPEKRSCLSASRMEAIGMYRVGGGYSGREVWCDDRRESPFGEDVAIRGDVTPPAQKSWH